MLIKNSLNKKYFYIFFISFLICIFFYFFERTLGIDKFYHPDSIHYLKSHNLNFSKMLFNNPLNLFSYGYYILAKVLNYNYLGLIFINFTLFSLTNTMILSVLSRNNFIENLVSKKKYLTYLIIFFDPYRLHLSGHILKETILIFLLICIIYYKNIFVKTLPLFFAIVFRRNIIFYLLIFLNLELIKNFFLKFKFKSLILFFILFIFIIVFFNFFSDTNLGILETLNFWHYRDMGGRSYDGIPNYQNFSLIMGLLLKIITWPILILSGLFLVFTKSILFKFLGIVIVFYNFVIYFITKQTYISTGLFILIILISLYSTTFTSFFRYSYIAMLVSIVYFFGNFQCKKN